MNYFLMTAGGVGDTICRCTFPKSNQTISVHAEYMCCLCFLFVCLFVFRVSFRFSKSWQPCAEKNISQFLKTLANAAC